MRSLDIPMQQPAVFSFEEFGPTPATSQDGIAASTRLLSELGTKNCLLIDFTPVKGADVSFMDAFFSGLKAVVRQRLNQDGQLKVVAVGMSEDVRFGVQLPLNMVDMPGLAYQEADEVNILTDNSRLNTTFEVGQVLTLEQGAFTNSELADEMDLQVSNTNQRLARLLAAGAIARFADKTADRGKRFLYQAAIPADLNY